MKQIFAITLSGVTLLTVPACENLTQEQRTIVGVTGGAAAGLITADMFDANKNWRLIAALGGAAIGTIVAENATTKECAYARGDGTYLVAPCP